MGNTSLFQKQAFFGGDFPLSFCYAPAFGNWKKTYICDCVGHL